MMLLKSLYLANILLSFQSTLFPVTAVCRSGECTSGFLASLYINDSTSDLVTLPDSSLSFTDPLFDFTQWIFPDVNFTCSANITSWRLRVNNSIGSGNTQQRPLPQITTWRLQNLFGNRETYIFQSITNESLGDVTITEGGVYEYTPSRPISVQAGDIVGIKMPPSDDERTKSVAIKPLFLRLPEGNSSTVSCARLGDSQYFFLDNGLCLFQQQQLSLYIPLLTAIIIDSTMSPSSTLEPISTAINMITNVAPTVTMAHTIVSTAFPSPTRNMSPTTTKRLDKGLVIGILIAGAILFVLAMMSIVIFTAIVCLKQQEQAMPLTSGQLQQEMLKESESVAPHHGQLPSEDHEMLSPELTLKSNDACHIPNAQQQVSIEIEENVAYNFNPGTENEDYYSNNQYDYEEISDY